MQRFLLLILVTAALLAGQLAVAAEKCDVNISSVTTSGLRVTSGATHFYQDWSYTVDPGEWVTCIGYFALGNTRFTKAPVFTSNYGGDHLGWNTYISPDRKSVFLFGSRTHFGPNLTRTYTVSYKLFYDDSPAGQDTVLWDGTTQTFSWSRTGTPGNGLSGTWGYVPQIQGGPYAPLSAISMSAALHGLVSPWNGQPVAGQAMQVGPATFGSSPGDWGTILSYSATPTLPQLPGALTQYGWSLSGKIENLDSIGRTAIAKGNWWLYDVGLTTFALEQGTYQFMISWPNGWEQQAQVHGTMTPQEGSTVASPWPTDYADWSSLGAVRFTGMLSTSGLLTGDLYASDDKLAIMSPAGQDTVFVQSDLQIGLELDQKHMASTSVGYQAFLGYDPSMLGFDYGSYTIAPYGSPFTAISGVDGKIDLAAGTRLPTQPPYATDAKLADLLFTSGQTEGITQVGFRAVFPGSRFSDLNGDELVSQLVDGPMIVVDNTPPTDLHLSASPDGWTNGDQAVLTFSGTDPLSGIARYDINVEDGDYWQTTSPCTIDISGWDTGEHTVTLLAVDRADNESSTTTVVRVDRTAPSVSINGITQGSTNLLGTTAHAIQGGVTITVAGSDANSGISTPPVVTVTDASGAAQVLSASGTGPWTYTYTVTAATANGTAHIDVAAQDAVGNPGAASASFNVNKSTLTLHLSLTGVAAIASFDRNIRIAVGGDGGGVSPLVFVKTVPFDRSGNGLIVISDLSNDGAWTKVSAKDEQHTLRRTVPLDPSGSKQYQATLILASGDATNDNIIDIRDFGLFAGQYGTLGHPYSTGRDADFSCNGLVWTEDFSILRPSFMASGDPDVGGSGIGVQSMLAGGPVTAISVTDLARTEGKVAAQIADVNKDGVVDMTDVQLFVQTVSRRSR